MTKSSDKPQLVLVVDDNEDDFDAMKRAFNKIHFPGELKHILSGQEALDYLQSQKETKPQLIILDLNMPGLDGRMLLKEIKNNELIKTIPVVIMTTSNNERDIKICYNLGANTYLKKPMDFDELINTTKKIEEYWFEFASLPND